MILGYGELLKHITGAQPEQLEHEIETVMRHKPSEQKIAALKQLAKGKDTVSGALRAIGANNTGGSYNSVKAFFEALVDEGTLIREEAGRRTYYRFAEHSQLEGWLRTTQPNV